MLDVDMERGEEEEEDKDGAEEKKEEEEKRKHDWFKIKLSPTSALAAEKQCYNRMLGI